MTTDTSLVTVRLLNTPVDLWQSTSAHQEAIQREFDIIRAGLPDESIPHRLSALISEVGARFGEYGESSRNQVLSARQLGARNVDLTFVVPRTAAEAARTVKDMLDEVDVYCRSGEDLLTLVTPDDQVAFREWVLGEFGRQIEQGLEPVSWTDHLTEADEHGLPSRPPAGRKSETIEFADDLDLATAGRLRSAIQNRRAADPGKLTLDLSNVGFVDSVGVSLLVATHNRLTEDGVEMRLIVPHRVYALLALTGLTDILKPEESAAVING